jgi:hypothetical protein
MDGECTAYGRNVASHLTLRVADGVRTRLPLRWPLRETGKIDVFPLPSRPVDTQPACH